MVAFSCRVSLVSSYFVSHPGRVDASAGSGWGSAFGRHVTDACRAAVGSGLVRRHLLAPSATTAMFTLVTWLHWRLPGFSTAVAILLFEMKKYFVGTYSETT